MAIDPIEHAISNWKDENYVTFNSLFVFNSCGGWDEYEITDFKAQWIVINKGLKKVGHTYQSIAFIKKTSKELLEQNKEYFRLIDANNRTINDYLQAILNHIQDGKN